MATPVGRIEKVEVIEYTSGKVYAVSNGGSVTVNEERVRIKVTAKNIGDVTGAIYIDCIVNGASKGIKSLSLSPNTSGSVYWDVEIPQGGNKVTVSVGHEEEFIIT